MERRRLPLYTVGHFSLPVYLSNTRRTLNIPFPTAPLASTAQKALFVDAELSPLVRRSSQLCASPTAADGNSVLRVVYAATTDRMLRVAVNGFFESLGVVVGAMKELDVDVIYVEGLSDRDGDLAAAVMNRLRKAAGAEMKV